MSAPLTDALTELEKGRDALAGQLMEQRSVLAALKRSSQEVAALASGHAFAGLFAELLLALDRLKAEDLTEELRDSVIEEILGALESRGLHPVDNVAKLNLRYHEVVGTVVAESLDEDGRIVEVLREGYLLGDSLLRPSRVVVARYPREG